VAQELFIRFKQISRYDTLWELTKHCYFHHRKQQIWRGIKKPSGWLNTFLSRYSLFWCWKGMLISQLTTRLIRYSTHAIWQGVDISFTVYVCFLRLRISLLRIKLAVSNFDGGSSASKAGNDKFLWTLLPRSPKSDESVCSFTVFGFSFAYIFFRQG